MSEGRYEAIGFVSVEDQTALRLIITIAPLTITLEV
jgi:hypothetical protein